MKVIFFNVPDTYVVPESLLKVPPDVISKLFDCINDLISIPSLDMECIITQYTTRLENQKHQFLKEREEVITQHKHEHEKVLNLYKKQADIEVLLLKDENKRLHEDFENELQVYKKRVLNNTNDEISTLKENLQTLQKTHVRLLEENTNEKMLMHKLYETNLNDKDQILQSLTARIDEMMTFFRSFKSFSSTKGQFGENCLQSMLQEQFPLAEITDTSHIPHAGDILMNISNITIMIEMKTKLHVTKEDLLKFEYDITTNKHDYNAALFVTTSTGIPNKGEFVFDFINNIPVLYISKILESPFLLQSSISILQSLVPIFQKFNLKCGNTISVEYDNMINSLSCIINSSLSLCDCMRQNNKLFTMISQQLNEQKKKNEHILQTCINDITRITEIYKTQLRKTNVHPEIAITDVFNALYKERKTIESGKYVYKNLVQKIIDKKIFSHFHSVEQVVRFIPKSKFEQMFVSYELTLPSF